MKNNILLSIVIGGTFVGVASLAYYAINRIKTKSLIQSFGYLSIKKRLPDYYVTSNYIKLINK